MSTDPISVYDSQGLNYCKVHSDTYPFISPKHADLSGKHVLITGASKGIGYATAVSYAQTGAAAIAVTARSSLGQVARDIEQAALDTGKPAPKIIPIQMDVTSRTDVEAFGNSLRSQLGYLDIAILNVGTLEPVTPIIGSDIDLWWRTYETNIFGTFLCLRQVLPLLIASPGELKTVINISSGAATAATPGNSAYQSTKLALCRLTEHIMAEVGGKGILAYAVHPGNVATDLSSNLSPERRDSLLKNTAKLPGDTLVWLTKERRDWLAGRYVSCQWDMEEFLGKKPEIEARDLLKFRLPMGGEDLSKATQKH